MLTQVWLSHQHCPGQVLLGANHITMIQRTLFNNRAWDMRNGHCVSEKLDNIIVRLEVIDLWKAPAEHYLHLNHH